MPRYDDNHGNTRLFVGHLSSRTRSRDLERLFSRYGRIRKVDMKHDFAFVDFSDPRDADDARYNLDHREVDGSRITVEYAKGVPRGSREYLGRGPPPGSGRCFNCGLDGHWARDCKAGDWKNKCYRCGERGHKERDCKNSPKKISGRRSYSRSPVRSRSPHRGRSRDRSYSRDRSHSQSRSPVRRGRSPVHKDRSVSPQPGRCYNCGIDGHWARDCKAGDLKNKCYRCGERGHKERDCKNSPKKISGRSYSRSPVRSRSPHRGRSRDQSYSRDRSNSRSRSPVGREGSPVHKDRSESPKSSPPSSKIRNDSPTLDEGSPQNREDGNGKQDGSDYSKSPGSPKTNGGHIASPRDDRSPIDDVDETRPSPRGSESP